MVKDYLLGVIPQCTEDDLDTALPEQRLSPGAYSTGNHHRDSLLRQPFRQKARLVSGRWDKLLPQYLISLLVGVNDGKLLAMTKV